MEYLVRRVAEPPPLDAPGEHPAWSVGAVAEVGHFHPQSADHRPVTRVRLLHDDHAIFVHFDVADRFVRAAVTQHQGPVCGDSCVEFFVEPKAGAGYFNIEVNCIGTILMRHVTDHRRVAGGELCRADPVSAEALRTIDIFHSLDGVIAEEIPGPLAWRVAYRLPFAIFASFVGPLDRRWRGNFFKCADRTSHPHWASWSPIGPELNFHLPEYFAPIRFE